MQAFDAPYRPGERTMIKVKHQRTADCAVAGFRWHKKGAGTMVGSLLLGLYDDHRTLHHVGVTAAFTNEMRKQLVAELAPLRQNALDDHPWRDWAEAQEDASAQGQRLPGATSRWNRGKDLSWEPLRPERVCEVAYDHMQGARFRHAAQFVRWRPDKSPRTAANDSWSHARYELERVFGARGASRARDRSRVPAPPRAGVRSGDVAQIDPDAVTWSSGRAWSRRGRRPPAAGPRLPDAVPSTARGDSASSLSRHCDVTTADRPAAGRASTWCRRLRRDGETRGGSSLCFL